MLNVGIGQTYATLAAAIASASGGDTINVQAGTYTDQVATINKPLTIVGVGGMPVFTATANLSNGKGFLVVDADVTIDNISFSNAQVTDLNGAGIRYEAGAMIVRNSQFIGNQNGILATPFTAGTGSVLVEGSIFTGNGITSGPGSGLAHAIYATQLALLTIQNSIFQDTRIGHDIKSRAAATVVTGNMLEVGVTGTASYAIDVANGGAATVTGNTITQGPNTDNWAMLAYAAEGLAWTDNALLVEGNLFANTLTGTSIGVYNHASGITAQVVCNAFNGLSQPVVGPADLQNNVINSPLPACASTAVPEPAPSMPLLAGCLGLLLLRRRAAA